MMVNEAAELVRQADALATGGKIFVLSMGAPVKIIDQVQRLILLVGKEVCFEVDERSVDKALIELTARRSGGKCVKSCFWNLIPWLRVTLR